MKKNDYLPMSDMGFRFFLFRKAIRKSRMQTANELNARLQEIVDMERGDTEPKIKYLHFLNRRYGLNINWVMFNQGGMFINEPPPDVDKSFVAGPGIKKGDPSYETHFEFLQLMQVPMIEKIILDTLEELKNTLREVE